MIKWTNIQFFANICQNRYVLLNSGSATLESWYVRDRCWLEKKSLLYSGGQQPGKKSDSSPRTEPQLQIRGQELLKRRHKREGRTARRRAQSPQTGLLKTVMQRSDQCHLDCFKHAHVCSAVSDSLQPHGLWPARLLCPWNFPGKNTGAGCHFLLQGICAPQGLNWSHLQILYHWVSWEAHFKHSWSTIPGLVYSHFLETNA